MRPLTERERQVVHLIIAGHTHQEIADQLAVSHSAVRQYHRTIDTKLGLPPRPEGRPNKADRLAYQNRLKAEVGKQRV